MIKNFDQPKQLSQSHSIPQRSPRNIIDKEFKDICCDAKENKIIKKKNKKRCSS